MRECVVFLFCILFLSFVRAGWCSGRDGGGEGEGATAARNRRRRGARALAKEEEPEPGEDWEGEERPEEYAGLFDDP